MIGRPARIAAAGLVVCLAAACGPGDAGDQAPPTAEQLVGRPPAALADLAVALSAVLEPDGLVLTRGPLIDRADGQYEISATGTHLALYVQPPIGFTDEQYIAGLRTLTMASADLVFSTWPAVDSFDICQEPPQAEDDREEPAVYTQVDMTRALWASLPDDVDLPGLLARSFEDGSGLRMSAKSRLQDHPDLAVPVEEAKRRAGAGDPDVPTA